MSFKLRFTEEAAEDLERLYRFAVENDPAAANQAFNRIEQAWVMLEEFPFSCRKPIAANPFIRELLIPFGSSGYVALFEIENDKTVTVLALRHQREEDYH